MTHKCKCGAPAMVGSRLCVSCDMDLLVQEYYLEREARASVGLDQGDYGTQVCKHPESAVRIEDGKRVCGMCRQGLA